jgi:copper(I)-binding protein
MYKKIILITSVLLFCCANVVLAADAPTQGSEREVKDKEVTIKLSGAWARASFSSNNNSAAYMSINNPTDKQITILGASAATVANNVELHKSFVDEKGISRMTSIDKIVVPANSTISLAPGGIHVMLFDLKRKLAAGGKFKMILALEDKDAVAIDVVVK